MSTFVSCESKKRYIENSKIQELKTSKIAFKKNLNFNMYIVFISCDSYHPVNTMYIAYTL